MRWNGSVFYTIDKKALKDISKLKDAKLDEKVKNLIEILPTASGRVLASAIGSVKILMKEREFNANTVDVLWNHN